MKEYILITDLTHVAKDPYSTNLTPHPIASIKSYFVKYSKHSSFFKIEIFMNQQNFI